MKLNGMHIENDPKAFVARMLSNRSDLQYWSTEALKDLYIQTLEMALEISEHLRQERKNRRGKRPQREKQVGTFIRHTKIKLLKARKNPLDNREGVVRRIYNEILQNEGHSPLRGFGMGNRFGNVLAGNPEWQSVNPIIRPTKGILIMAVTKKQLIGAGKELQEVLNVGDPDKFDPKASYDDMKEWMVEASEILTKEDEITAATAKVLNALAPEESEAPEVAKEETQSEEPTEQTEALEEAEQESPTDSPEDEGEAPEEDDAEPPEQEAPPEEKAETEETLEEEPEPKPEAKAKKKDDKPVSGFSLCLRILCKTPDIEKKALIKQLEKEGVDMKAAKNTINSTYSSVRKVISLLRENGHME